MLRPWAGYLVAAGTMVVVAASCTQDFDQLFEGPETITVTTTGSGATSSTTTSQGGNTGGGGGTGECSAPDDCAGISTTCRYKTCEDQTCGWASAAEGTSCDEDPGNNVCNGSGTCVECNSPADCPNPTTDACDSNECVPPHCTDGTQNEDESDEDCGGADCAPCEDGLDCLVFSDCQSQFCDSLVCAPCANHGDCADATDTWCDPTANDGNGGCVDQFAQGFGCGEDEQCLTGFCTDGACCVADNCPGECVSCNKAGSEGTCTNLDEGTSCSDGQYCNGAELCDDAGHCDPGTAPCPGPDGDADCSETCNETNDNCDDDDQNGTVCSDGLYCNGGDTCFGGTCTPSDVDPCAPYSDGDCAGGCDEANDDCGGDEPDGSACEDGVYCTGGDTCSGGACTAGVGSPCPPITDADCVGYCDEANTNCSDNEPPGSPCSSGIHTECNDSGSCTGP